jgi:hypothetical protein
MEFNRLEYDMAVLALNEYFMVRGQNHPGPHFIDL